MNPPSSSTHHASESSSLATTPPTRLRHPTNPSAPTTRPLRSNNNNNNNNNNNPISPAITTTITNTAIANATATAATAAVGATPATATGHHQHAVPQGSNYNGEDPFLPSSPTPKPSTKLNNAGADENANKQSAADHPTASTARDISSGKHESANVEVDTTTAGVTMDGKANSDEGNDTIVQKQVLTMEKLHSINRPSTSSTHDPVTDGAAAARNNRAKLKNKHRSGFAPCGPNKRKDASAVAGAGHASSSSLPLPNTNSNTTTNKRMPRPPSLANPSLPSTTSASKNERQKPLLIAPPRPASTHPRLFDNNERLPEADPNPLNQELTGYKTPLSCLTPPAVKKRDPNEQSRNGPRVSLTQSPRQQQQSNANNQSQPNANNNANKPIPDPTLIMSSTLRRASLAVTKQSTVLNEPDSPVPISAAAAASTTGRKPFDSFRMQNASRALSFNNNQVINVDETPSPIPPSANIPPKRSNLIAVPSAPPLPPTTNRHPSVQNVVLPSVPRKDPTKESQEDAELEYERNATPKAKHIMNSRNDDHRQHGYGRGHDYREHRRYYAPGRNKRNESRFNEGIDLNSIPPERSSRKYLEVPNHQRNSGDSESPLPKRPRPATMYPNSSSFSPSSSSFHDMQPPENKPRALMAFTPNSSSKSVSSSVALRDSSYRPNWKFLSQQGHENAWSQRNDHNNRSIAERKHGTPGNNAQREAQQREPISIDDDDNSSKPQDQLRLPPNPQPFPNISSSMSDATRAATEAVGLNPEPLHHVETTSAAVPGTNSSGIEIVISVENNSHVPNAMTDANMNTTAGHATKAAADAAARAADVAGASARGNAVDVDVDADDDENEKMSDVPSVDTHKGNASVDSGAEQPCREEKRLEEWQTIQSDPNINATLMNEALEEHPRLLSFPFLGLSETDVYQLFEANMEKLRLLDPSAFSDDEMDVDADNDSISVVEIENNGGKSENVVVNVDDVDDEKKTNNSTSSNESSIVLSDSLGRWIDLNNNQICTFDNQLCNLLRKLHVSRLNLAHNELKMIPNELGFCSRLRMLDLSHNNVRGCLPDSITQLEHLEVLDVSHNRIERIPPNFHRLKKLQVVLVSHNCLSKIPEDFVEKGTNLIGLDISHNPKLTTIPSCLKIIAVHNNGEFEYKATRLYKIAPPKDPNGRLNSLRNLAGKTLEELLFRQENGRFPPPPQLVNDVKHIDPNARRTRAQKTSCTI